MGFVHSRIDTAEPTKQQRRSFDSGEPSLDKWLATRARQSMESRDAVTYLLLDEASTPAVIAGYYCLSSGEVARLEVPREMAKRAPGPIPAVRMGRLAVDRAYQGKGLGAELLREALLGAVSAGGLVAARVMLVDAINAEAVAFYKRFGFEASPINDLQLMCDLRTIALSAGLDDEA